MSNYGGLVGRFYINDNQITQCSCCSFFNRTLLTHGFSIFQFIAQIQHEHQWVGDDDFIWIFSGNRVSTHAFILPSPYLFFFFFGHKCETCREKDDRQGIATFYHLFFFFFLLFLLFWWKANFYVSEVMLEIYLISPMGAKSGQHIYREGIYFEEI